MLRLTFVIGGILTVLGVVAYVATGAASVTALIPTFVGVLLLVCAVIGTRGVAARKHAMHAAVAISLLAALGALGRVVSVGALTTAVIVSLVMIVLLVVHVAMGVRSFVAARKARA